MKHILYTLFPHQSPQILVTNWQTWNRISVRSGSRFPRKWQRMARCHSSFSRRNVLIKWKCKCEMKTNVWGQQLLLRSRLIITKNIQYIWEDTNVNNARRRRRRRRRDYQRTLQGQLPHFASDPWKVSHFQRPTIDLAIGSNALFSFISFLFSLHCFGYGSVRFRFGSVLICEELVVLFHPSCLPFSFPQSTCLWPCYMDRIIYWYRSKLNLNRNSISFFLIIIVNRMHVFQLEYSIKSIGGVRLSIEAGYLNDRTIIIIALSSCPVAISFQLSWLIVKYCLLTHVT